jgi:hypothetical protein
MSDAAWYILGGVFAVAAAIFYVSRELWIHDRRRRSRRGSGRGDA